MGAKTPFLVYNKKNASNLAFMNKEQFFHMKPWSTYTNQL